MENGPRDEDILAFIQKRSGRKLGALDRADVLSALQLDGAEAEGFMTDFGMAFDVDLAGYDPAFHHHVGSRAGRFGWPIAVPYLFGVRMPVAVSTMALAARKGKWPLRYPVLSAKPARDWINWLIVLALLPSFVALLVFLVTSF